MAGILLLWSSYGLDAGWAFEPMKRSRASSKRATALSRRKTRCCREIPRTPPSGPKSAQSHAQAARDATHSLPWNIAAVVPWLGSPFKTGQQISDVVLGLAADVLQPSADVGAALSPDRLLEDGRVDVQLLRDEEPELSKISADATQPGR